MSKPLTYTQLQQMKSYCDWAAISGAYYGSRVQFVARHAAIVAWIEAQLKEVK